MWETIGPYGSAPVDDQAVMGSRLVERGGAGSDELVLGVSARARARRGRDRLATGVGWARGDVPTPHGTIRVGWSDDESGSSLQGGRAGRGDAQPFGRPAVTCSTARARADELDVG